MGDVTRGPPIVVVSGLPRSGTSLMMGMLAAGGMETIADGRRVADPDNPNGYHEHEHVKALVTGADREWLAGARGGAIKVVSALLPYLPEDHDYRVILMVRDLDEVIASQRRMLAHRGEIPVGDDFTMREVYIRHLVAVGDLVRRRGWDFIRVGYETVIARPHATAERVDAFLGGGMDVTAMAAMVDPGLYHNRR